MPKVISDNQILEAALDVITQEGYAGATTRQIAAVAGINEVTLFRRFGNKQNLLNAVVEQEAEKFATAGIDYTGNIEADLEKIVHFYGNLVQERGNVIVMLINEIPRQPELIELMQSPFAIITKVTDLIARYQQEGKLVTEPPLQALLALVGPLFLSQALYALNSDLAGGNPLHVVAHVRRYLQGRRVESPREARA